jgi:hypothetical protein
MPMQKLQFKPGINRDVTALAAEGGWYASEKVRFRVGFPEKIGGWARVSTNVYQGVCRSLSAWTTLGGLNLIGVGTNLKMYVANGGVYYDVTPVRATIVVAANAFTTDGATATVTFNVTAHGANVGDYVVVTNDVATVGGITPTQFNAEFLILTTPTANTFTAVVTGGVSTSVATGGNGTFAFQLHTGTTLATSTYGWGAGPWGGVVALHGWGDSTGTASYGQWSQVSYGENLIFGQVGGPPYIMYGGTVVSYGFNRGVLLSSLGGATSTPLFQNMMTFSPSARILVLFGTNSILNTSPDPLMVRWADSDSLTQWAPAATNQAGEYRIPRGSAIVAIASARQDTLILTDVAAYIMQYIGAPYVFGFTQQSDNISTASRACAVSAGGNVFWMGKDKFYVYDGRVSTLTCTVWDEVFGNLSLDQLPQSFGGTNEAYNEIWWFYNSTAASSGLPDKYVIYNYVDHTWAYGNLTRTAWLDTALFGGPLAATAVNNIVVHESGVDDNSTAATLPISASVQSADFDIGDGQQYAFIRKVLPDVNFAGSTTANPQVYMSVMGKQYPGGPVTSVPNQSVVYTTGSPVDQWTSQLSVRIRARQINVSMSSTDLGVKWQFGTPRVEVRPDGRTA